MNKTEIFKVSEITQKIKQTLELNFFSIQIEGEISNYRPSSAGHVYFTLKDNDASIQAVMFNNKASQLNFTPKDGMQVLVSGNISVYAARGNYQIICNSMEEFGVGRILAMLEERKQRLQRLGHFDKKREIPKNPSRIAVITSPTGAAVQDIINIATRRSLGIEIKVLPAIVQGAEAAKTVVSQIRYANKHKLADVIIIARGGGSVEDLLPFSEEIVVNEIYNSEIPTISAIGHEIDFALSDFAADLRAPTPSAAAELVTEESDNLVLQIKQFKQEIINSLETKINNARLILNSISTKEMLRNYNLLIAEKRQTIDITRDKILSTYTNLLKSKRQNLNLAFNIIEANCPQNILKKGYAIISDEKGKTIKASGDTKLGAIINIQLKEGKLKSEIKEII